MAGRRHQALIEQLQRRCHHIRTTGFRAAFRRLLFEVHGFDDDGTFDWFRRIPDAYEIHDDEVVLYEVEDTHRVSDEKMVEYARLWYGLRETELITFRLIIVDIRGGAYETELWRWWYGEFGGDRPR